jgi:hypothetical protein
VSVSRRGSLGQPGGLCRSEPLSEVGLHAANPGFVETIAESFVE